MGAAFTAPEALILHWTAAVVAPARDLLLAVVFRVVAANWAKRDLVSSAVNGQTAERAIRETTPASYGRKAALASRTTLFEGNRHGAVFTVTLRPSVDDQALLTTEIGGRVPATIRQLIGQSGSACSTDRRRLVYYAIGGVARDGSQDDGKSI
jgi:hypothetical protein